MEILCSQARTKMDWFYQAQFKATLLFAIHILLLTKRALCIKEIAKVIQILETGYVRLDLHSLSLLIS